jgi:hypothetical protein
MTGVVQEQLETPRKAKRTPMETSFRKAFNSPVKRSNAVFPAIEGT